MKVKLKERPPILTFDVIDPWTQKKFQGALPMTYHHLQASYINTT